MYRANRENTRWDDCAEISHDHITTLNHALIRPKTEQSDECLARFNELPPGQQKATAKAWVLRYPLHYYWFTRRLWRQVWDNTDLAAHSLIRARLDDLDGRQFLQLNEVGQTRIHIPGLVEALRCIIEPHLLIGAEIEALKR